MHSLLSKYAQHDLGCRRTIKHNSFIHSEDNGAHFAGASVGNMPGLHRHHCIRLGFQSAFMPHRPSPQSNEGS